MYMFEFNLVHDWSQTCTCLLQPPANKSLMFAERCISLITDNR